MEEKILSKDKSVKFNKKEEKSRFRKFLDSFKIVKEAYTSAYDDNNEEVRTAGGDPEIDRIFNQAENNIAAASRAYDRKPTNVRRPVPNNQQYRPSEEDLYEMRARQNGDDEISNEKEIGSK